jgi:nicotinate dehydrogenase subunit B
MVGCHVYDAAGLADADVQQGLALVQSLGCPKCHQAEPADSGIFLTGKTTTIVPDAAIFPKNLTPDPVTGLGCWSDPQIINAILNGIDDQDAALCTMPKFAARLDGGSAQAALIVAFLRTLPPVRKEIPESQQVCPPPAATDAGSDTGVVDAGSDVVTADGGADATPATDATAGDATAGD